MDPPAILKNFREVDKKTVTVENTEISQRTQEKAFLSAFLIFFFALRVLRFLHCI